MAGDLERLAERIGGETEQLALALRPVGVIRRRIDAGDALVTGLRPGPQREVDSAGLGGSVIGARGAKLAAGRSIELTFALDGRPSRGRAPLLGVDGEIVDRVFVL